MPFDPARLTATQAAARLRAGSLTAEQLARACLDRVAARDGDVRAWSHVDADRVLAEARARDRAGPSGPLHGLPIGIKDVILTRDLPTQYNSPLYQGFHPVIDAACVKILRAAGAVIFGKTDTVEFAATGRKALTRNPRDLTRTPGGSSSGSAAAVADCHVPLALGTQTGGSTIRPASYCGVPALKPTWGLVSFEGVKTYSPTLDTLGWYGRSIDDLALLLEVLAPLRPGDAVATPAAGPLRVALCRTPSWDQAEAASQQALIAAAERFRAAGVVVDDLDLPDAFAPLADLHSLIMRAEGRAAFLADYAAAYDNLDQSFRDQVENVDGYTPDRLTAALDRAACCRPEFDRLAAPYDAVLTPSAPGEAPAGLAATGTALFNRMWTLLHTPCVNLPGLVGPSGLPVGVTLTGPRFSDRHLLATAARLAPLLVTGAEAAR